METGHACSGEGRILSAASLVDKGDVAQALTRLDFQLADQCRDAVLGLAGVLHQAGLVTDESLLLCGKPFLKAAIKLSILASFAAGRPEDEKILASLYCQLAQFQDVSGTGFLVFDGSEGFLDDEGSDPEAVRRNAARARTLRRVADEFHANRNEMAALSSRLERLR